MDPEATGKLPENTEHHEPLEYVPKVTGDSNGYSKRQEKYYL